MKRISFLLSCLLITAASFVQAQNDVLPDVQVANLDGKTSSIKDYIKPGKIYVVDFWATWCSPCKRELDAIKDLYPDWVKQYNVELIAVSIDDARGASKIKPTVEAKGWEYTVLLDKNEDLKRGLNISSVPFTLIVDKTGKIVYTHSGYTPGDENELEDKIKEVAGK
jgi:peroxiredoxin